MKCSNPGCAREITPAAILKVAASGGIARCSLCRTMTTIPFSEIRSALRAALDDGTKCPCCSQFAKRYRRKLNVGIARWLIALVRLHAEGLEWVHIAWIAAVVGGEAPATAKSRPIGMSPIGSGDYAKARYWELIEDKPTEDSSKKDSGFWRVTEKGRAFVAGSISLPARAVLFNNLLEGFDGDQITIKDALSDEFNYEELMRQ